VDLQILTLVVDDEDLGLSRFHDGRPWSCADRDRRRDTTARFQPDKSVFGRNRARVERDCSGNRYLFSACRNSSFTPVHVRGSTATIPLNGI
jgi:hypothetical protein